MLCSDWPGFQQAELCWDLPKERPAATATICWPHPLLPWPDTPTGWRKRRVEPYFFFLYSTPIWSDNCAFVMRAAAHLPLRVRVLRGSGQRLRPLLFSVLFLGSYLCCVCFVPGCVLILSSVAVWWLLSVQEVPAIIYLFFSTNGHYYLFLRTAARTQDVSSI